MKRIKLILLLIFSFLLCGCSATYRLNINKDGTVDEKITLSESKSNLSSYTVSLSDYLNEELTNIKNDGTYSDYLLSVDTNNNDGFGTGERQYSSIDKYKKNSIIINEMFNNILIDVNGNITKITFVASDNFKYFEDSSLYDSLLNEVKIEINLPYKVVNNNADNIDDDVYIWNIKKGESLKNIEITYDTSVTLLDIVPIEVLILVSIIIIIGIIVFYIYIKYKMNSK